MADKNPKHPLKKKKDKVKSKKKNIYEQIKLIVALLMKSTVWGQGIQVNPMPWYPIQYFLFYGKLSGFPIE